MSISVMPDGQKSPHIFVSESAGVVPSLNVPIPVDKIRLGDSRLFVSTLAS